MAKIVRFMYDHIPFYTIYICIKVYTKGLPIHSSNSL